MINKIHVILLTALPVVTLGLAESYTLSFSTFFGGHAGDVIRDVETDAAGHVYVAGTTRSVDFPTTSKAFQKRLDTSLGETRWGYNSDMFIAKFSPDGQLIWSTLVGGPNSEEAYGLELDSKGCVIVHGRGAVESPITRGVYQEQFMGCGGDDPGNPHNTAQNAYIAKLSPDGASLIWAGYFGIDQLHRDLALDPFDDIVVTWGVRPEHNDMYLWGTWMKPLWNRTAFQPEPVGGADCGVAKISGDGRRVIWATFLGGSGDDSIEASVDVDKNGYVYVGLQTSSADMPTTEGAFDRTHNGGFDWYVAKLTPDGSDMVYGTFIGDEGDNWLNTHNLVVDDDGNCYSSTCATSSAFPTSENAIQTTHAGSVDWGIVKLSPSGGLLAATLLGGTGSDNPDGIRIDHDGNLVVFGQSHSADFPTTPTAYQPHYAGNGDAVVVKLNAALDQLLYSTFIGGNKNDNGRAGSVDKNGNLIIAGTSSANWPLRQPWHDTSRGDGSGIIAKFKRNQ